MKSSTEKMFYLAEATLIYSLGSLYSQGCQPGRLKGLYRRIVKLTEGDLEASRKTSTYEHKCAAGIINAFLEEANFEGQKDVMAVSSFVTMIVDESEFKFNPELNKVLIEIIDYFDRAGKLDNGFPDEALTAYEKWNKIVNDIKSGSRPMPIFINKEENIVSRRNTPKPVDWQKRWRDYGAKNLCKGF